MLRTSTRSLPFRNPEHVNLGYSRSFAFAQFLRNEDCLGRDTVQKDTYDSVIKEKIALGHMKPVPPHTVLKPDITKMYRQIFLNAAHTLFQTILFRNDCGDITDN